MARLQSFRLEDVAEWRSDSSSDDEYSDARSKRASSASSLASVFTGGWSPRSTLHTAREHAFQEPMPLEAAQADLDAEGSSSACSEADDDAAPASPAPLRHQTPAGVVSAALPFQMGCLLHGGFGLILRWHTLNAIEARTHVQA
jgi:hypothetical protein